MTRDIFKRKNVEFQYFEGIQDGIIISKEDGNTIYANNVASKLLGLDIEDIIAHHWWSSTFSISDNNFYFPENIEIANAIIDDAQEPYEIQCLITKPNDTKLWTKWSYNKVHDGLIICTIKDINKEQKFVEEIEHLQKENTFLCQEMHHRVKNNMQIVMSLLNLQFRNVSDLNALKSLAKSKDRMVAITCIQDYLGRTTNCTISG